MPTARPSNRASAVTMPGAKLGRSSSSEPLVGQQIDGPVHVVDPASVPGHHLAELLLVGCGPGRQIALKEGEVATGHRDGLRLVVTEDIDHAVGHLHRRGADLLGREDPESAPLDHGRATHPDVGVWRGDDHVATAEQRGVAGEAATRDHADQRNPATQRAEAGKRLGVEPGDDGVIRVARTSAAAFGEEHHRQA